LSNIEGTLIVPPHSRRVPGKIRIALERRLDRQSSSTSVHPRPRYHPDLL